MKILNVLVMSVVVIASFGAEVRADDKDDAKKVSVKLSSGASTGDLGISAEVGADLGIKPIASRIRLNGAINADVARLRAEIDAPKVKVKDVLTSVSSSPALVSNLSVNYNTLTLEGQGTVSRKRADAVDPLKVSHAQAATGFDLSLVQAGALTSDWIYSGQVIGLWTLAAKANVNAAGGVARLGEHEGPTYFAGVEVGGELEHKMLFLTSDAGSWGYGVEGKASHVFNVLNSSDLDGITSARGRISAIFQPVSGVDISVGPHAAVSDYRFRKPESGEAARPSIQAFEVGASAAIGF